MPYRDCSGNIRIPSIDEMGIGARYIAMKSAGQRIDTHLAECAECQGGVDCEEFFSMLDKFKYIRHSIGIN